MAEIKREGNQLDAQLRENYDVSVNEAIVRLRQLRYGLLGVITFLSAAFRTASWMRVEATKHSDTEYGCSACRGPSAVRVGRRCGPLRSGAPNALNSSPQPQQFLRPSPISIGRQDLNLRPPGPQPGALPDCATPRGKQAGDGNRTRPRSLEGFCAATTLRPARPFACYRRSSLGTSPEASASPGGGHGPNQLSRAPSSVTVEPLKRAAKRRGEKCHEPCVLGDATETLQRDRAGHPRPHGLGILPQHLRVEGPGRHGRHGQPPRRSSGEQARGSTPRR